MYIVKRSYNSYNVNKNFGTLSNAQDLRLLINRFKFIQTSDFRFVVKNYSYHKISDGFEIARKIGKLNNHR